jgi:hypothetical protein
VLSRVFSPAIVAFLLCGCSTGGVAAHLAGHGSPPATVAKPKGMPGIIKASVADSRPVPGRVYFPPGTPVSAADIGTRAAGSGAVVYGLANRRAYMGSVWPVISTDGGLHWQIDGPAFAFAGAAGPSVTDRIGARGAGMAWAWGTAGNFVKVTTDGGKHWYLADFPAGVKSVRWQAGHLTALAYWNGLHVFRYVSPDNGRTWRTS